MLQFSVKMYIVCSESLDKLDITAIEDRELILSKLYELQHTTGPVLDEIFSTPIRSRSPASSRGDKSFDSASSSHVDQQRLKSKHTITTTTSHQVNGAVKIASDVTVTAVPSPNTASSMGPQHHHHSTTKRGSVVK